MAFQPAGQPDRLFFIATGSVFHGLGQFLVVAIGLLQRPDAVFWGHPPVHPVQAQTVYGPKGNFGFHLAYADFRKWVAGFPVNRNGYIGVGGGFTG